MATNLQNAAKNAEGQNVAVLADQLSDTDKKALTPEAAAILASRQMRRNILRAASGDRTTDVVTLTKRQAAATIRLCGKIMSKNRKKAEMTPDECMVIWAAMDRDTFIREIVDPAFELKAELDANLHSKFQSKLKGGKTPATFVKDYVTQDLVPASKQGNMKQLLAEIADSLDD